MTPPNATIADHPGHVGDPQRSLPAPNAQEDEPSPLADRQSGTGSQIEEASQKLGIARPQKQLCDTGPTRRTGPPTPARGERQATAGCASDDCRTSATTSTPRSRKSGAYRSDFGVPPPARMPSSRDRDWRKRAFSLKGRGNLPRSPHALPDDSPSAGARRRNGGEFHDRDRSDDRLDRHAADRRAAGRLAALQLGVLGVPVDSDRDHRGVRQAGRSRRPQDGHAGRDRDLPLWLDLMRIRVVDAVADRLPAGPGHRRRRGPADRHDHRRRSLFGARAGEDPGLAG